MSELAIYQKQDINFAETVAVPENDILKQFRVIAVDVDNGGNFTHQYNDSSTDLVTLGVSQTEMYEGGSRLLTVADSGLLAVEINKEHPPEGIGPLRVDEYGRAAGSTEPYPSGFSTTNAGADYTPGTYTDVPSTTSGSGTGLVFSSITFAGGGVYQTSNIDADSAVGYEVGDTLSVTAANVGGTGSGFLLTISSLAQDSETYEVKCNSVVPIVLEHDERHALVRF